MIGGTPRIAEQHRRVPVERKGKRPRSGERRWRSDPPPAAIMRSPKGMGTAWPLRPPIMACTKGWQLAICKAQSRSTQQRGAVTEAANSISALPKSLSAINGNSKSLFDMSHFPINPGQRSPAPAMQSRRKTQGARTMAPRKGKSIIQFLDAAVEAHPRRSDRGPRRPAIALRGRVRAGQEVAVGVTWPCGSMMDGGTTALGRLSATFLVRPIQQRSATGRFLALKKTSRGVR
jgi:hypothetical protein